MRSLIGLTSLLFRVRAYAQLVAAGPIRGSRFDTARGLLAADAFALHVASFATGRRAGHPDDMSDRSAALLFRGRRSGCLLDPG
jgi:hypothetical protein